MKPILLFMVLATAAVGSQADSYIKRAKVVSSSPIYERVKVSEPREICHYQSSYKRQHSDPAAGAIVGGTLGAILTGPRASAETRVAGAIVGGVLGAQLSGHKGNHWKEDKRKVCRTEYDYHYERQLIGYDVSYKYGGEVYFARMPYDPGRFVRVRVEVSLVD